MEIVDAILFWANVAPRRPAIIQPEGVRTYRILADAVLGAADHFSRALLDPQRPVAVSFEDPARMLVASLGLLHAGFSIVPVSQEQLAHLPSAGASTLVSERGGLLWPDHETIFFDYAWPSSDSRRAPPQAAARSMNGGRGNMIFFTSGSTGKPKAVVHTQAAREQRILHSKLTMFADFERALMVPGLSITYGFHRASEILHAGKTLCYAAFGQPMLLLANSYDIDMIFASVQQALALAEIQEKSAHFPLSALKALRIGGGLISREGVQKLKLNLCRNIILAYASTEAGIAAMAPHDMIANIPSAVGFVVPDARVEIVDAADNVLPVGQEGFVRLQTPLFRARVNASGLDPDADPRAQWYYPGDLGWLTENGVLCIAGRSGDVVNRGGVKLATPDFEEFLKACPGVRDAGVCSVMGAGFAEIWVGVVLDPGIDMGAFRRHIESNPKFGGNIDNLFVVEEIPRGETGKLQRKELENLLKSIRDEK